MSDIIFAPFSNSHMRDWPIAHFATLAELLLPMLGTGEAIRVFGTASQKLRGCEVVRYLPADRVVNDCGRHSWPEAVSLLRRAKCIVSNNSGVGHLGGFFRRPTVCVFGGSHQREEWRPLGDTVVLVSRAIGCSPCQLDHGQVSPYNRACLRGIEPRTVADAVRIAMRAAAAEGEG